jgi:flagellar biosynthesis/type III secretory pathway protein FliH
MLDGLPGPSSVLFQLEQSRDVEDVRDGVKRLLSELKRDEQTNLRRAFATWLAQVLIPARISTPAVEIPEVRDLMEIKTMLEQRVIEWTQEWKAEGLAEGRQLGREEGRREGQQEGERSLLRRQLEMKFGALSDREQKLLLQADSSQLIKWSEQILNAESIADALRD